jgi:glycosyltransferase involved in cell wall biosynthesis
MVVHAEVPADPRIRRQAEALLAAGHEVDIFCLRAAGQERFESSDGLRIHRLPMRRRFESFGGHLAEYVAFAGMAAVAVTVAHRRRRYRLLQVATLPDFLVASGAVLKLRGVPLLLDLHEDMPAFFDDRFASRPLRPLRPVIATVARASAAMADALITVHEPLRSLSVARGVAPDRITVVMNSPDEELFDPGRHLRRPYMEDGQLRLVHHSSLQQVYGADIAVWALAGVGDLDVRLDIYGEGPYRPQIEAAIRDSQTGDRVSLHGRLRLDSLPAVLAGSDVGLVPTRPEPYAQYSLSTKFLEYAWMGVPIIASDLKTFRSHLTDAAVRYVPGNDPAALAAAVREAATDPDAARERAAEAQRQARPYGWRFQAQRYVALVERLMEGR